MGGAQKVNWGGFRQQGLTFESDDDWFTDDDWQTISNEAKRRKDTAFSSGLGRLSAMGILWSAGSETRGP